MLDPRSSTSIFRVESGVVDLNLEKPDFTRKTTAIKKQPSRLFAECMVNFILSLSFYSISLPIQKYMVSNNNALNIYKMIVSSFE